MSGQSVHGEQPEERRHAAERSERRDRVVHAWLA
jgi:hypothetical protein